MYCSTATCRGPSTRWCHHYADSRPLSEHQPGTCPSGSCIVIPAVSAHGHGKAVHASQHSSAALVIVRGQAPLLVVGGTIVPLFVFLLFWVFFAFSRKNAAKTKKHKKQKKVRKKAKKLKKGTSTIVPYIGALLWCPCTADVPCL